MAGMGSRFKAQVELNPEYKKPKPLILVKGEPMIMWALKSLPFINLPNRPAKTEFKVEPKDLIFIILKEQEDAYGIEALLREAISDDINVIVIPALTRGALESAMAAKDHIKDYYDSVIVSDSDHYFDGEELYKAILNKDEDVKGLIPVFKPRDTNPKWSYTLIDENNIAQKVGEKDAALAAQGAPANIGAYYFASGKLFAEAAQQMIDEGDMFGAEGKKEFYVAPLYDRMIRNGYKVKGVLSPQVWGLGTPEDHIFFEINFQLK